MEGFLRWVGNEVDRGNETSQPAFQEYFAGIAEARYVIRRMLRIVDEEAKRAGLDALEHQLLIQVFGSPHALQVHEIAARLDIVPAFASRLIKNLEEQGLVSRAPSPIDGRATIVATTEEGRALLSKIDGQVHRHVAYVQDQFSDSERMAALGIFAFYLGIAPRLGDLERVLKGRRLNAGEPAA